MAYWEARGPREMIAGVGVLRLVTDDDARRAAEAAERAADVQAAAISRALEERGAPAPAGGRLLPEAIAVRACSAPDRLTRRVEALRAAAAARAEAGDPAQPSGPEAADGPPQPPDPLPSDPQPSGARAQEGPDGA